MSESFFGHLVRHFFFRLTENRINRLLLALLIAVAIHAWLFFSLSAFAINPASYQVMNNQKSVEIELDTFVIEQEPQQTEPAVATQTELPEQTQATPPQKIQQETPKDVAPAPLPDEVHSKQPKERIKERVVPPKQVAKKVEQQKQIKPTKSVKNSRATGAKESSNSPAKATIVQKVEAKALGVSVNKQPVYPDIARRRGQQGKVLLLVDVNESGQVVKIAVQTSSGHSILDNAALNAVKNWRFSPASVNGKAQAGKVVVPVEFKLTN